jgi:hypothetical protein
MCHHDYLKSEMSDAINSVMIELTFVVDRLDGGELWLLTEKEQASANTSQMDNPDFRIYHQITINDK